MEWDVGSGHFFAGYFLSGRALKKKAGEQGLIRCYDHSEHPADSALMGFVPALALRLSIFLAKSAQKRHQIVSLGVIWLSLGGIGFDSHRTPRWCRLSQHSPLLARCVQHLSRRSHPRSKCREQARFRWRNKGVLIRYKVHPPAFCTRFVQGVSRHADDSRPTTARKVL